jgi:hypothetical protein
VPERELGGGARRRRDAAVVGDARPRPERELEAGLQVDEDDRAVFDLPADDALGGEAEPSR